MNKTMSVIGIIDGSTNRGGVASTADMEPR